MCRVDQFLLPLSHSPTPELDRQVFEPSHDQTPLVASISEALRVYFLSSPGVSARAEIKPQDLMRFIPP
jgi:hypothetical protein